MRLQGASPCRPEASARSGRVVTVAAASSTRAPWRSPSRPSPSSPGSRSSRRSRSGSPGLRLPAIVLEILLGIAVGPQGLNWAHVDEPVRVFSLIGLAFLLLLAGLEIDFTRLRGRLLRLIAFLGFVLAVAAAIFGAQRSARISATLLRLQDTTAEIRVRGAFLLLVLFVVLASSFGLEAILGAFLAGAMLKLLDRDEMMTRAFFHRNLEAAGFGVFVPFFFVATGLRLDVSSLFHSGSALARVPIFLAGLLAARALPALLYRPLAERGGGSSPAGSFRRPPSASRSSRAGSASTSA
jgi:Kef-type K+ transport system membrane component KefB